MTKRTFFTLSNQRAHFTRTPTTCIVINQKWRPGQISKDATKRTFFTLPATSQLQLTSEDVYFNQCKIPVALCTGGAHSTSTTKRRGAVSLHSNQRANYTKAPTTGILMNQNRRPRPINKEATKGNFFTLQPTNFHHQTSNDIHSIQKNKAPTPKQQRNDEALFFSLQPTSDIHQTPDYIHFIQPSKAPTPHQQKCNGGEFLYTPTNKPTLRNPRRLSSYSTLKGTHVSSTKKRRRALSLHSNQQANYK